MSHEPSVTRMGFFEYDCSFYLVDSDLMARTIEAARSAGFDFDD